MSLREEYGWYDWKAGIVQPFECYCDIDTLDGHELEDGERLRVEMPDGSEREQEIVVKESSEHYSEQGGHGGDAPISKAYFVDLVNGVEVLVPLAGLRAARVRAQDCPVG